MYPVLSEPGELCHNVRTIADFKTYINNAHMISIVHNAVIGPDFGSELAECVKKTGCTALQFICTSALARVLRIPAVGGPLREHIKKLYIAKPYAEPPLSGGKRSAYESSEPGISVIDVAMVLTTFDKLTSLWIDYQPYNESNAAGVLDAIIKQVTKVRELTISVTSFAYNEQNRIFAAIETSTTIQKCTVMGYTSGSATVLSTVFKNNTLRTLRFVNCNLPVELMCIGIGHAISTHMDLVVYRSYFGSDIPNIQDMERLADAFAHAVTARVRMQISVHICECKLPVDFVGALLKSMSTRNIVIPTNIPSLELVFSGNSLSIEVVALLGIQQRALPLHVLDFSNNDMSCLPDNVYASVFHGALAFRTLHEEPTHQLVKLSLANTRLTNDSAAHIVAGLMHIPTLKTLDLSHNGIGRSQSMRNALKNLVLTVPLRELVLSHNNLDDDDIVHVFYTSNENIPFALAKLCVDNNVGLTGNAVAHIFQFFTSDALLYLDISNLVNAVKSPSLFGTLCKYISDYRQLVFLGMKGWISPTDDPSNRKKLEKICNIIHEHDNLLDVRIFESMNKLPMPFKNIIEKVIND